MISNYVVYNIVPLGFLILLIYIFIDICIDYFRKSERINFERAILYSFLFYAISLIQIKFGGITIPPQDSTDSDKSFILTNEWFSIYDVMYTNISIKNSLAVFYNVLLFIPLGFYLSVLFNLNNLKKVISIAFLICISIDFSCLLFSRLGLIIRVFNNMDIIFSIFNIFGAVLGFLLVRLTIKDINNSYRYAKKFKRTN